MTQEKANGSRNRTAVVMLRELGFPLKAIRQAMPKLTGVKHQELAAAAQTSRQTITLHLAADRGNPRVQGVIADVWGVSSDLLFGTGDEPITDEAS